MLARVALLCAVECVVVALLAMQVFGSRSDGAIAPPPLPDAEAGSAAAGVAMEEPPPPPPPAAPSSTAPARTEAVAKWRPDDPIGVLLTGTVHRRDGSPADCYVNFTQGKVRKGVSTEKDGSYAIVGLQPGEWEAGLRGDNIVEAKETVALGDDAVQRHDFVCDPSFPVKVMIVTADGADATMALRKSRPWFGDFSVAGQRDALPATLAPTDYGRVFVGDAQWRPEMNPSEGFAGMLYLTGLPAHVALLQRHLVLQQQLVQPDQEEVKFVVDVDAIDRLAASATLRVLDDTGAPLPGARISLHTSNIGGGGQPADEAGRITLAGLSPGLLQLEIEAKDHESVWKIVQVEPGQNADLGEFRLGAAAPLKGTVVDADGRPAGGNLTWTELKWRTAPTGFRTNRTTRIDADGSFSLWGTGSGPIAVQVHAPDGRMAAGVFDNPPAEPVVLRLGAAATCTVTRPAEPTRAFVVTVYDASRRPMHASVLEARTTKATISLPPGTYTFEVHDEHQRLVQSGSLLFGESPCSLEIR